MFDKKNNALYSVIRNRFPKTLLLEAGLCMGLTIKELSELAGVSKSTASKVMTGKDKHISEKTRSKIISLANKYNYRPNQVAKSLKSKTTKTIGLIIPDISNPFFAHISKGVHEIANRYEYGVFICSTENNVEQEISSIQMLQTHMVEALIMIVDDSHKLRDKIKELTIPYVFIDRIPEWSKDEECGTVFLDVYKEFYNITKLFIEKKCKHLCFIGAETLSGNQRFNGYYQAIKDSRLEWNSDYVYFGNYDVKTGYEGCEKLLAENPDVDGFICANDLIAMGAIHMLRNKKISVPENIKVSGFDDIELSSFTETPLTTIRQPSIEFGTIAANMIFNNIIKGTKLENIELQAILKQRNSL